MSGTFASMIWLMVCSPDQSAARRMSASSWARWTLKSESRQRRRSPGRSVSESGGRIRRGTNSRPFHTGFITDEFHAGDRHLRRVDDRQKTVPRSRRDWRWVKQAPDISPGVSLPSRAFRASSPLSTASLGNRFLVGIPDHRNHQPFGVSAAKAMWKYCLSTRFRRPSELLNSGNSSARRYRP